MLYSAHHASVTTPYWKTAGQAELVDAKQRTREMRVLEHLAVFVLCRLRWTEAVLLDFQLTISNKSCDCGYCRPS